MRRRAILALALACAAAAGACKDRKVTVDESGADEQPAAPERATWPRLFAEKITEIRVGQGEGRVVLARAADGWTMTAPIDADVDPLAVKGAVGELTSLEWSDEPIARGEATWAEHGVDPASALALQVVYDGEPLPILWLGNRQRGRVGDHPDVYEIYRFNRQTFGRELRLWRDRRLARIDDAGAVKALTVRGGDGARVRAVRTPTDTGAWSVDPAATTVKGDLDPRVPAAVARFLVSTRAHDIVDDPPGDGTTGLGAPRLTLTAELDGESVTVAIGETIPASNLTWVRAGEQTLRVDLRPPATIFRPPGEWIRM